MWNQFNLMFEDQEISLKNEKVPIHPSRAGDVQTCVQLMFHEILAPVKSFADRF